MQNIAFGVNGVHNREECLNPELQPNGYEQVKVKEDPLISSLEKEV